MYLVSVPSFAKSLEMLAVEPVLSPNGLLE